MPQSVVKRTGDPFTLTWDYNPAHESQIDEFRVESSPSPTGTFSVVVGGIPPNSRLKDLVAGTSSLYYRIAAVKNGTNASYAGNVVQLIVDNTPHPPENFQIS